MKLKKIISDIESEKAEKRYAKIAEQIKKRYKIRVIFLTMESSKWSYQSLYEYFEKDELFEPLVVVSMPLNAHKGKDTTRKDIESTCNFFKSRNINVKYGYKNGKYINLKNFKPDIVFYEQQWELPKIYRPQNVSHYALTCYTGYAFNGIFNDLGMDYGYKFHKHLFRYFVPNKNDSRFQDKRNCLCLGYTKLDTYLDDKNIETDKIWNNSSKVKIVYAPHHSFEKDGLHTATFRQNGLKILEIAKKHPETTWIFKPHPRFKYSLISNNIMSEKEVENYYNEWDKIAKIYDKGNYFDIFKTSDLMITDCCSFLAEYLPSGHPLIHLVNKDAVEMTFFGRKLTENYYNCENFDALEELIIKLENKENDYKYEMRQNFIPEIIDMKEKASYKIYKHLRNNLIN